MLAALLNRGCLVNGPTNDGWTALHEAAANGHALIVDKLLASGAQVSSVYMPSHTSDVPTFWLSSKQTPCTFSCFIISSYTCYRLTCGRICPDMFPVDSYLHRLVPSPRVMHCSFTHHVSRLSILLLGGCSGEPDAELSACVLDFFLRCDRWT